MKKMIVTSVAVMATAFMSACSVDAGGGSTGGERSGDQAFGNTAELFEAIDTAHGAMEGKRIAFVPILYKGYNITSNWGATMERAFASQGADFKVYDANFDTDKMVKIINDIVAKKSADVLVLHNPDVGVLTKQIEAAERAGIYTVVVNLLSNRLGDAFIGPDMLHAAEDVTTRAVEDCNKSGGPKALAVIDGPGNDALSLQWEKGVNNVAKKAGFDIVATSHTQWQNSEAQEAASAILQQHKGDVCAFMVAWELNSIAVGNEIKSAASRGQVEPGDINVYTLGGDVQWCDALRSGTVKASAAYDVQGIGEAIVVTVQQLLQGAAGAGAAHTVSYVAHTIVDESNVDDTSMACYRGR